MKSSTLPDKGRALIASKSGANIVSSVAGSPVMTTEDGFTSPLISTLFTSQGSNPCTYLNHEPLQAFNKTVFIGFPQHNMIIEEKRVKTSVGQLSDFINKTFNSGFFLNLEIKEPSVFLIFWKFFRIKKPRVPGFFYHFQNQRTSSSGFLRTVVVRL